MQAVRFARKADIEILVTPPEGVRNAIEPIALAMMSNRANG